MKMGPVIAETTDIESWHLDILTYTCRCIEAEEQVFWRPGGPAQKVDFLKHSPN